jgi:C-terminal processing protease CtpA/Prc
MNIKRFSYILLIAAMLACNFITSKFAPFTALTPAYIPSNCQNIPLATVSPATSLIQPTPQLQANPEISQDLQKKVFDDVVGTIKRVYVYPDFNGKDWPAIVSNHRAKIASGLDTENFYTEMQAMLTELGDEHSQFESPVDVAISKADLAGNNEFVGVGIYALIESTR